MKAVPALFLLVLLLALLPARASDPWIVDFEPDGIFLDLNPTTLPQLKERLEKFNRTFGPVKAIYFRFGSGQSTDDIVRTMFDFHQFGIETYILIATAVDGTRTTLTYDHTGNLLHREQQPPPTHRYTAELEAVLPAAGGYHLWFNLRQDGDSYTTWQPHITPADPEFARFERDLARLPRENIYYEITLNQEIPRSTMVHIPRLGIVTPENMQAVGALSDRLTPLHPQLPITSLVSIRPITQNEYLHITPKIVQP